jgi:hypothetical protein
MQPTRIRFLIALAVLAGAVGWSVVAVIQGQSGRTLPVPWLAAVTMWVLAISLGAWALISRPRLLRRPGSRPMPPLVAARTAALAMAASRTGALVAGLYAGICLGALSIVTARETAAGQTTLFAALTTLGGALGLTATALWLEHICRLPQDPGAQQHSGGSTHKEPGAASARVGSARFGDERWVSDSDR